MIIKNAKTILFASLIALLILPLIGSENVFAQTDADKTDLQLMKEAEVLAKTPPASYEITGSLVNPNPNPNPNPSVSKSNTPDRFDEIVIELNSRGIYHSPTQTIEDSLDEYVVSDAEFARAIQEDKKTLSSSITESTTLNLSPIENLSIGVDGKSCPNCSTSSKMLKFKSGMSWPNSFMPLWEHRVESKWSSWTNSYTKDDAVSMVYGSHENLRPYVIVTANKPITWASFQVGSEIGVKTKNGYVSLGSVEEKKLIDAYFPTVNIEKKLSFSTHSEELPKLTQHRASIQIFGIK